MFQSVVTGVPLSWFCNGSTSGKGASSVRIDPGLPEMPRHFVLPRLLTDEEKAMIGAAMREKRTISVLVADDDVVIFPAEMVFRLAAEPQKASEDMSEKVLVSGVPRVVRFETDTAEVWFNNSETDAGRGSGFVSHADAAKALDAMHEKRDVEIVDVDGVRAVRVLPKVEVLARGRVNDIYTATGKIWVGCKEPIVVSNIELAARAYVHRGTVEVVRINGGAPMVRDAKA